MELINRDEVIKRIFDEGHIKAMGGNNWIRVEEVEGFLLTEPTRYCVPLTRNGEVIGYATKDATALLCETDPGNMTYSFKIEGERDG